jgi:cysteine synthase
MRVMVSGYWYARGYHLTHRLPVGSYYLQELSPTPLRPIRFEDGPEIWCKLDFLNPSGSTKDRIARFIVEKAWRERRLGRETTVVEASSGSTSIALALVCAQMGLRFVAVMPEGVSNERVKIIRAYGGQVRMTPRAGGIRSAIAETERMAESGDVFLPRQFSNQDNAAAHRFGTAREILNALPVGAVDAVVSGVGTGGTLVGLYRGFCDAGCRVVPVHARPIEWTASEDAECCSFSTRIPGVVDSISEIFSESAIPGLETVEVRGDEALETTRKLMCRGFPVGPSSGLNYRAAQIVAERAEMRDAVIVTIFPDRMERYFSTELFGA